MPLSRKAAAGVVASAAAALITAGMGSAHAGYYDYYGSFAVGDLGDQWIVGIALNAEDQATADQHAMEQCGDATCYIAIHWANGCAALVERDGRLYTGRGNNVGVAEHAALAASGSDPNPLFVSLGSAEPSTATVLISKCTA
ncbi:DUF4189 domain-containing protein [Nocardia sp. NPDC059240]|uniref:DUF4189 domain-containing protein n=1 Tax=Nocardia sp. NPDC059240 TaxID=3346786 RepID=UPI00368CA811